MATDHAPLSSAEKGNCYFAIWLSTYIWQSRRLVSNWPRAFTSYPRDSGSQVRAVGRPGLRNVSIFPMLGVGEGNVSFLELIDGRTLPSTHVEIYLLGSVMYVCVSAKSLQSCLILCNPMDCCPWGSSVRAILQAKILKWSISFSRGSSWPGDWTRASCIYLRWQVGSLPLALPEKPHDVHSQ